MRWIAALAGAALAMPAAAQIPDARTAGRILAIHNRERAQVRVPPLAWDRELAAAAAAYAPRLAALGRLQHSPREARAGQGENLASGTIGYYSPEALTGLWAGEKSAFRNGLFPNVGTSGAVVGHYSQMIWRETTRVGCATAAGGGDLYLVCRYAPAGNVIGRRVY